MDRIFRTTAARIAVLALALVIAGSVAGCAGTPTASEDSGGAGVAMDGYGYSGAGSVGAPAPDENLVGAEKDAARSSGSGAIAAGVDKLIVINKTVRIETADVDASIDKIRELADRDGGDIASMQISTSTDEPIYPQPIDGKGEYYGVDTSTQLRAYVTVRVPSAKYSTFVADVMKLGKVLYQAESSDDVTQQHVDMAARLENMKAEQSRLRELFKKASKVSDMLAIEQELTRVQGEIESMQAQLSYLEDQAAMATVTIELKEPTPVVSPSGIDWGTRTAFTDGVRAFVNTMNGLIVLLGPALALVVFVGVPVWFIVWFVRRRVRRRRAAAPVSTASTSDPGSEA